MKAIILAAGRGSRMKALTNNKPKCLINFKGKPLIEWQISALREAGINEIAIVTGYKKEMLKCYMLNEFYNPKWAETQMVSSLMCASEWLENDICIVSYSDIFYESKAVNLLGSSKAFLTITYDADWLNLWSRRFGDPLLDAESFKLDDKGGLREIGFRPDDISHIQGQYMGLLRFTPNAWFEAKRIYACLDTINKASIHLTGMLQKIIEEERIEIQAVKYNGKWGEIDSQRDLEIYINSDK